MNNLHSAFLIEGFDGSYRYGPDEPEKTSELLEGMENNPMTQREIEEYDNVKEAADARDKAIEETKMSLQEDVVDSIINDPYFSNIAQSVIKDKRKKDKEHFKENKENFEKRLNQPNAEGKKYSEVWNEKIAEGYKYLIKELEDSGFFKGDSTETTRQKKSDIKIKYFNQVKAEYTNIWEKDDKYFEENKDKFFDATATDYVTSKSVVFDAVTKGGTTTNRRKYRSNALTTKSEENKKDNQDSESTNSEDAEEVDSPKAQERMKFLSEDLPNYLWEIKSTTFGQKLLQRIPAIVSGSIDRPSDKDREAIRNFIRVVDRFQGDNVELKLIEAFNSLPENASEEDIKNKLVENNIKFKNEKKEKRNLYKTKKAFDFYISVMKKGNNVKNQHRIYTSVIDRIVIEKGFDKAIAAYKQDVAEYKQRIKDERKGGKAYEKGKKLESELKDFADALNIAVVSDDKRFDDKRLNKKLDKIAYDYTRITRLSEKPDDYFQKAEIVDILSDLNNDGLIRPSDKGVTKTGTQFKEAYERAVRLEGEDEVLGKLLEHAKLYNSYLGDKKLSVDEFTKEQIQAGNKKLILLLQSIIADPGQDFFTLLRYGPDSAERLEGIYNHLLEIPTDINDPRVQEKVKEIMALNKEFTYIEGLPEAVAGAIITGYTNLVGVGATISFDEWVNGLALNTGVQAGKGGAVGGSLNLSYGKTIPLGKKGGYINAGASLGISPTFNGTVKGEKIPFALNPSTTAWAEFGRQRVDKNATAQRVGFRMSLSYTNSLNFTKITQFNTLSTGGVLSWERNKAEGIEASEDTMKDVFQEQIMIPLLNKIAEKLGDKEFDLTKPENTKIVDDAIYEIISEKISTDKKSHFYKKYENNIKQLKENTVRLLINYNNAPIGNPNVRKYIASEMSERYAAAWVEQRLDKLDGKTYLSGARLGASLWWFVGTTGWGRKVHAGVTFTKHEYDGYGDVLEKKYTIEEISGYERNEDNIAKYNKWLNKDAQLKLVTIEGDDEQYIQLSPKVIDSYEILINKKMKEHMKKDKDGNVLLSTKTYIQGPDIEQGTATYSVTILIGGGKDEDVVRLDEIVSDPTWFTDGKIDTKTLPGKEVVLGRSDVDKTLNDLKDKLKKMGIEDEELQAFKFEDKYAHVYQDVRDEKGQKRSKIILTKENGEISCRVEDNPESEVYLEIEYTGKEKVDLMKKTAQDIADAVYLEARKVKTNALSNISHRETKSPRYVRFANQMRDKDYQAAYQTITELLPEMDEHIKTSNFSSVLPDLEKLANLATLPKSEGGDGGVALGQALLSINNVFARVTSVQQGTEQDEYRFIKYINGGTKKIDTSMGDIIQARAGEIKRKINDKNDKNNKLSDEVRNSYTSLIDAMEQYRIKNPEYYKATSKKRTVGENALHNAVGINLGNAISIENPLFNPEIYEDSEIELSALDGLDSGKKAYLQEHAMHVMAEDKSLMGPVLERLGISLPSGDKIVYRESSYEDGTLILKIFDEKDKKDKEIKFTAEMSVGYFSQCVNHMILLKNVEAEIIGGNGEEKFKTKVGSGGSYKEYTVRSIYATQKVSVDMAYGESEDETPTETEDPTTTPTEIIIPDPDTTPTEIIIPDLPIEPRVPGDLRGNQNDGL